MNRITIINGTNVLLVILAAILLSGCEIVLVPALLSAPGIPASSRPIQGFECGKTIKSSDLVSIQTIAILDIPEPPNYGRDSLYASINAEYGDLSFGNTAQAFLEKYLEEKGFEVIEYSPNRENEHRLIDDYTSLDIQGADAYLDVVPIEVAYAFRDKIKRVPFVSTSFRLVSADSNETIYAGSVIYGAPEEHKYESSEVLKANKKEASEWLIQGIEAVSFSIAKKIVKREFESDLNNNELSEHGPGFTGTYISTITGNTQGLNIKGRNPEVKLTQNGKNISGTFGCKGGIIWGEIEDGTINFKFQTLDGGAGIGKWIIKPDSKEIIGKWSSHWRGEGEWNLERIK